MTDSRLTPLQQNVLGTLAGIEPPWTLTGGGALAGFHLCHRATRDLDLFWHAQVKLGPWREECAHRLRDAGFEVAILQRFDTFERLLVSDGADRVVLDLVAEPVPAIEPPQQVPLGATRILVDTPHEILVNKLCALLGRAELRDLHELRELLAVGGDLPRALRDAPRKDGGFSPLMLAFLLRDMPVEMMAAASGLGEPLAGELLRFRDELAPRLLAAARPGH
ncbi:MAG: nucleotidyl transferase AbiEii/AbiGii toxin family protein [Planctomycetes bacterium]|jgi:hypothetical protein|nr:nucleotidyl transferase AbiEii/AbiGii toxin family protein [Planctomycetota bacterium]